MACRRASKGNYFLQERRGEVAQLVRMAGGSVVAASLHPTCHPGLRSCQMEPLLFCSALMLAGAGNRSFVTLTKRRCF